MKKIALVLCASLLFAACSKPATETSMVAPEEVPTTMEDTAPIGAAPTVVTLSEQNTSGQSGTATLEEVDGKLQVTISLTGQKAGVSSPAHFHTGTCATPGAVVYPLTNVVDGTSVTMLDATLADVQANSTLINIHKSAAESKVYTACGEWGVSPDAGADASGAPVAPGMPL